MQKNDKRNALLQTKESDIWKKEAILFRPEFSGGKAHFLSLLTREPRYFEGHKFVPFFCQFGGSHF